MGDFGRVIAALITRGFTPALPPTLTVVLNIRWTSKGVWMKAMDRGRERQMTENNAASRGRRSKPFARRIAHPLAKVSLGLGIASLLAGFLTIPAANVGAASSIKSNKPYAQAQLVKLSNLPPGWTKSEGTWVGTSADDNSSSMLTMTQYPELSTCLGHPPALSVVAAEASSPYFNSKDQNTSVLDVADVYTSTNEAKSDFPPLNSPKFADCFVKVQGPFITSMEKSAWPSGATFGTLTASVSRQPRYGDQSGLIDVQLPVNLPGGQGSTTDYFVVLVIRQGRSTTELWIDQGGTTPSAALTESLAKAVTVKMKARPTGNTIVDA
jgi:hypothetical protein